MLPQAAKPKAVEKPIEMPKPAPAAPIKPEEDDRRESMTSFARDTRGSVVSERTLSVAEIAAKTDLAALMSGGRPSKKKP